MENRKRRRFTAEYKAEATKWLAESGKPLQEVADRCSDAAGQGRGPYRPRLTAPRLGEAVHMPLTAVQTLNNEVLPTFEEHAGAKINAVLSDNGREFCGRPDQHPYELFLQLEAIEHKGGPAAEQRHRRAPAPHVP
jgi:hypothetical protein